MRIIKPPYPFEKAPQEKLLFLAGSIDMGKAQDWQSWVGYQLLKEDVLILNPRRDGWDNSWEQSIDHPEFKAQVDWELKGLEEADFRLFHFEPHTQSPITLMELGLFGAKKGSIVHCPKDFWRKGNVDIVCQRYGIPQVDSLEAALEQIRNWM